MCLGARLRPRGDLVVRQARRGVRLQARKQRAVDRHLAAAAAALVILLRGADGGRTGLAVGRPRIEAQRDQLILDFAHIVMAERKRGIGLLLWGGRRLGGGRRTVRAAPRAVGGKAAEAGRLVSARPHRLPSHAGRRFRPAIGFRSVAQEEEGRRNSVNMVGYLA